jgi:putative transposase
MFFESNHIYHIYNQGNNHIKIFFNRQNYLFFLKKIHEYISPYGDVLAWCLMPNHFHLMVHVKTVEIDIDKSEAFTKGNPAHSEGFTKHTRTLNNSIGILLRAYTRAVNNQQKRSGSIYRRATKAECITKSDEIANAFLNTAEGGSLIHQIFEKEYLQTCFNYIHNNPVKAGLSQNPGDWEFSSYLDYCGLRKGTLVNPIRAKEFGLRWEAIK